MGELKFLKVNQRPSVARLSVRATGCTVIWEPRFQEAMRHLSLERGLPDEIPQAIRAVVVMPQALLLLWPTTASDPRGTAVRVSGKGRRVTTALPEPFADLNLHLPYGITIAIPAAPYLSTRYGRCLALHVDHAEFLYRRSRPSAIALQEDDD